MTNVPNGTVSPEPADREHDATTVSVRVELTGADTYHRGHRNLNVSLLGGKPLTAHFDEVAE